MFAHLQNLDDAGKTSWMSLPSAMGRGARLLLSPATQSNPGYFNATLKRAAKRAKSMLKLEHLRKEDVDALRSDDRLLYADHVVQGWEGLVDEKGQPAAFSRAAARDLCQQLPNWIFDLVREHASAAENFAGEGPSAGDVEALSGN